MLNYFKPEWITPTEAQLRVDLCVYGGTSAGLVAAYRAAELGLDVLVLNPGHHLGGLTAGGLGLTDHGRAHVIGGLSRQFYERLGRHYGTDIAWYFEPSAASAVFDEMIGESRVVVRQFQYLDAVETQDGRITAVRMLGGLRVEARCFVDASYEGDLLAKAGVRYHVGRESNEVYGESLNGIQVRPMHQFVPAAVDPYRTVGDPDSGLLPQVEPEDLRPRQGQGDKRVQAYNFRVCMTDDPELKIPWQKPDGYDPAEYELAARWFAGPKDPYNDNHRAANPDVPAKFDVFPHLTAGGHRKTDTNNHGPVSSDFIGANWDWPEATYAERETIFQRHVAYQKGFYWFMANDPRVPERYRTAYGHWGLPRDEFKQTGHWPGQLYVRESRRMIGDYVITEADCMRPAGFTAPKDSVGMGSYTLDSHNCTRFVAEVDGRRVVMNDGDVQVPPTDPYPISYRAIVPGTGQCTNLIVPICFSASHIAYGSARMEPVFMVLGEAAACAAYLAVRGDKDVQRVAYDKLQPLLAKSVLY
ncbi:MAG: FAD-dependent oxidoreductase [Phycisphaerae bacterium]